MTPTAARALRIDAAPANETKPLLGPVADLERHLPAEWWRDLFGELYLRTDGDVVENDAATRAEVDALLRVSGAQPHHRVLDLCCGQGRHAIELARRGFTAVTGIDQSAYLIELARHRAHEAGLGLQFRNEDARAPSDVAHPYDHVVILGNSFGYFESSSADVALLEGVRRRLVAGGVLTLDLTDGEWMRANFAPRSWEWIGPRQLVCRERSLAADGERLVSREVVVDLGTGVVADQFYAERLYSRDGIASLLEAAGFGAVRLHEAPPTISDRGQDLGLLQHRVLVTAVAQAPGVACAAPRPKRDVLVLLGDPRLPDAVKPGGHFGPEDIATVTRLREALGRLNYRVSYLDDHATLLHRLAAARDTLVLNLCDEGLHNRPELEAHVPALLESLGLPYTGAGPACLTLCFDKAATSALAAQMGVPVPREVFLPPGAPLPDVAHILPGIFKPNAADGSFAITPEGIVDTQVTAAAELARRAAEFPEHAWLLQELLTGSEYTVTLIGNPREGLRVLPVVEFDYARLPSGTPPIRSYAQKWVVGTPGYDGSNTRVARLSAAEHAILIEHCRRLFARLGCRDYARFDFRRGPDGVIRFLEANPNPGWCWDASMVWSAEHDGLDYPAVLDLILQAAIRRLEGDSAKAGAR